MTDNDFDKLLKQKLDNFEADVPNSCWDAISQALPPVRKTQRVVLWRRMAVAAVLAMAVSLAGFLFLKNDKNTPLIAKVIVPKAVQPVEKVQTAEAVINSAPEVVAQKKQAKHHFRTSEKIIPTVTNEPVVAEATVVQPVVTPTVTTSQSEKIDVISTQSVAKSEEVKIPSKVSDKELEAFINAGIEAQKQNTTPTEQIESKKSSSLALLAGLPTVSNSSDNEFHPLRSASAFEDAYNILSSNGNTANVPFERRHSIPFSLGFIIGKEVAKNTSIETGLHYTYLRSEQLQQDALTNEIQKLYYLGIPLSVTYRYANIKRFSFYLKAGGMVEKNVAGRWIGEIKGQTSNIVYTKTDNKLEETLQWSIHSGAGINFCISGPFYFYLEPSFTYFPDNGSEYQNIRKKEHFELSLQGGIRAIFASK
ncbi:MAG: porin family protein [Bacteroidales bacterium]